MGKLENQGMPGLPSNEQYIYVLVHSRIGLHESVSVPGDERKVMALPATKFEAKYFSKCSLTVLFGRGAP